MRIFLSVLSVLLLSCAPAGAEVFRADSGLSKAEAQLEEGKYMQALETLGGVLHRRPGDADALTYVGYAWHGLGEAEKAAHYYDRALGYDSKHLGANKYRADLYLEAGDFSRAAEQMQVLRLVCGPMDCAELNALQAALNAYRKKEKEKAAEE